MANKVFIQVEENETKVSMVKKVMKKQLEYTVKNPWTYVAMATWGFEGLINEKSMGQIIRQAVLAGVATTVIDLGVSLVLNKELIKGAGEE